MVSASNQAFPPEKPNESASSETIAESSNIGPRHLSRKTGLALGVIALLSGVAILGVHTFIFKEPITQTQTDSFLSVEAITLEPAKSYTVSRTYTGEVAAVRTTELGFEQGGELIWIEFDRGDRVEAGTPLAGLDTRRLEARRSQLIAQREQAVALLTELQNGPRAEDIEAAQSTVRDLETQLELEHLRKERWESLYTGGAVSREERDVVAFNAEALADRLATAQSQLEKLQNGTRPEQIVAQQAAVQQLSASIDDIDIAIAKSTIRAPFTGTIATRRLDEGAIVEAGQPVLRLVEQLQPEVEVGLPSEVVTNFEIGQSHPLAIEGQSYEATLAAILPEVDATTRTQTVVFKLDGVGSDRVAPEQLANLEIAQTIPADGFWLPLTALTQGERGLWVAYTLTQTPDSEHSQLYEIQRQDIEVIHAEGDRAFVQGTLTAGDRIVTDGTQRLVPGQTVRFGSLDSGVGQ